MKEMDDIRFLAKRVREQQDYIREIMQKAVDKTIDIPRSFEVIKSALCQHSYFELAILHHIESKFPVSATVKFKNWETEAFEWKVKEIFLKDGSVHLNSEDGNASTNVPTEYAFCIFDNLEFISYDGKICRYCGSRMKFCECE
jgi:hypothetical protein